MNDIPPIVFTPKMLPPNHPFLFRPRSNYNRQHRWQTAIVILIDCKIRIGICTHIARQGMILVGGKIGVHAGLCCRGEFKEFYESCDGGHK